MSNAVSSERWGVCMTASYDADYYDEEPHVWQIVPSRPRLARTIKRYMCVAETTDTFFRIV